MIRGLALLFTVGAVACGGSAPESASEIEALPAETSIRPLDDLAGHDFAPWEHALPDGVPVFSYPEVPLEERLDQIIDIEPDLVIGGDPSDPNASFYRANDIAVDAQGRIYVMDAGNFRIQVFDRDGAFVRTIGAQGQGPGEFNSPAELAVVGDRLMLWDRTKRRIVTWDLEGVPGGEIALDGAVNLDRTFSTNGIVGVDQATSLLVMNTEIVPGPENRVMPGENPSRTSVRLFALDGTAGPTLLTNDGIWNPFFQNRPLMATDGVGRVYVATGSEYQINAYSTRAEQEWALQVDWTRESNAETRQRRIDLSLENNRRGESAAEIRQRTDRNYPGDFHDALGEIHVDGHGHLYVFPLISLSAPRDTLRSLSPEEGQTHFVVDVFNDEGQHLLSGVSTNSGWYQAVGDYVYYLDYHPDTSEQLVVRGRLLEPFGR